MRKSIAAATMAASLTIGGAAGVALFAPTVSGAAQIADGTTEGADPAPESPAQREGRGIRGGIKNIDALTDLLGLDAADLRTQLRDGATLAEIADAQGVASQDVIDTLVAAAEEHLATHVADGDITQEEADAKLAEATEKIADGVENGFERSGRHRHSRGVRLDVLTDVLGIEDAELRTQLRDGATVAEIAEAQGVSTDDVVAALVANAEEHLAEKVAEGDLTQAEADAKLAEITEKITEGVENGFEGPGGRRGERGRRGPGGPAADAEAEAEAEADAEAEDTVAS